MEQKLNVYEMRVKLYLLQDIPFKELQNAVANFVDSALCQNESLISFHETNCYKFYSVGTLWPLERGMTYKKDQIYTLTVRTVEPILARYFSEVLKNHYTQKMKGLTVENRIIPHKMISEIYTLSPVIMKSDEGYWRSYMSLDEYEERLFSNLVKKYNSFTGEQIEEDFPLYTNITFLNRHPISCKYKRISLLGDKLSLQIADDEKSQKLVYFILGVGLCELNSRGAGFCNFRWF